MAGRVRARDDACAMRHLFRHRNPFAFFAASSRREEYLVQYVLREHKRGRTLQEILADPYVLNRSTPEQRARLLDQPELVSALGDLSGLRAEAAGPPAASATETGTAFMPPR